MQVAHIFPVSPSYRLLVELMPWSHYSPRHAIHLATRLLAPQRIHSRALPYVTLCHASGLKLLRSLEVQVADLGTFRSLAVCSHSVIR